MECAVILALGRQRQPDLHSIFQASQGYSVLKSKHTKMKFRKT